MLNVFQGSKKVYHSLVEMMLEIYLQITQEEILVIFNGISSAKNMF